MPARRCTASQAPGAFPRVDEPASDPRVALLLPYGEAMAAASAIVNVARNEDGVLRDLPVYEASRRLGPALAADAARNDGDSQAAARSSRPPCVPTGASTRGCRD